MTAIFNPSDMATDDIEAAADLYDSIAVDALVAETFAADQADLMEEVTVYYDNDEDDEVWGNGDEDEDGGEYNDGQPTLWDEYNGPYGLWGGEDSYLDTYWEDQYEPSYYGDE
jgi:hypothetical protein